MAAMNEGYFSRPMMLKVYWFWVPRRHISINASSPNPNPLRTGPNKSIQIIFQQELLANEMVAVKQIKQSMV